MPLCLGSTFDESRWAGKHTRLEANFNTPNIQSKEASEIKKEKEKEKKKRRGKKYIHTRRSPALVNRKKKKAKKCDKLQELFDICMHNS